MKTIMILLCVLFFLAGYSVVDAGRFDKQREKFNRSLDRSVQKAVEDAGYEAPTLEELEEAQQERRQEYDEWLEDQEDYDPELDESYEEDGKGR